jgi:hypothetical protein
MFFHTKIKLKELNLKTELSVYATQEQKILEFFKMNETKEFTPAEIHVILFNTMSTPLTSVRRAISNLTKVNVLKQTEMQRVGEYGAMNYCWKYNN